MANIIHKIANWFSGKKPTPPGLKITGHRGVAARLIANPNLTSYQQRMSQGMSQTISSDELEDFLAGGNPIFVHSSNVLAAQFYPDAGKMQVEFLNGSAYLVDPISAQEAMDFALSQSKGAWYWTNVRVRGSKTSHRKNVRKIK